MVFTILFINHTRPLLAYSNKDILKIDFNFKPFLKTIKNPEYFYSYNSKYSHETFNEISNSIFKSNCKYIE